MYKVLFFRLVKRPIKVLSKFHPTLAPICTRIEGNAQVMHPSYDDGATPAGLTQYRNALK
jgi:hypothetical protein